MGLDHVWFGLGISNCRTDDEGSFRRSLHLAFSRSVSHDGVVGGNRSADGYRRVPLAGLAWILAGGIAYTPPELVSSPRIEFDMLILPGT